MSLTSSPDVRPAAIETIRAAAYLLRDHDAPELEALAEHAVWALHHEPADQVRVATQTLADAISRVRGELTPHARAA